MQVNILRVSLCGAFVLVTSAAAIFAQESKPPSAPPSQQQTKDQSGGVKPAEAIQANPADVSSMDAVIKSVYAVISGDAGQKRDWNRFRSLFFPGARLIPTGINPTTKKGGGRVMTPDEYVERNTPFLEKEGFFESEIARRVETYGTITHVFSSYQSKHKMNDEKPFARGVNSIQLLNDGSRWWILTIAWSAETPENPLPDKYLKTAQ